MSRLNDPRVLFAAERTLMAWSRTSVSLMAFGFVVERFDVVIALVGEQKIELFQRYIAFVVGITFVLLGSYLAIHSIVQYRRVLKSLRPAEIPIGYNVSHGVFTNAIISILGVLLTFYLSRGLL
jgi:putative membrane protein